MSEPAAVQAQSFAPVPKLRRLALDEPDAVACPMLGEAIRAEAAVGGRSALLLEPKNLFSADLEAADERGSKCSG